MFPRCRYTMSSRMLVRRSETFTRSDLSPDTRTFLYPTFAGRYNSLHSSNELAGNEQSKLVSRLDRKVIAKPLFNLFSLRGKHDSLPAHDPGTLAVLRHNIRTLVEHLYDAILLRTLEVKGRGLDSRFLHYANPG